MFINKGEMKADEYIQKTREYLDYLEEHIENVRRAFCELSEKCQVITDEDCAPAEIMCTEIDNMKRDDTVFFIKFKEFEDCDSYSLHLNSEMMKYSGKLFIINSGNKIEVFNLTTPTIFFEGFFWPLDTFTVLVPGTPESGPCYSIPCGSGVYVERTPKGCAFEDPMGVCIIPPNKRPCTRIQ